MNVIRINKENKNVKGGFFDQRGFIELIENNNVIIAISSGWRCNGYLYVYRCKNGKWIGNWESEETFPIKNSLELQEEFYKAENIRLSTARLIFDLRRSGINDITDDKTLAEIAKEIIKILDHYTYCDLKIKHTSNMDVWNLHYHGDSDVEESISWTPITHGETNGFQWCITHYENESHSEEYDILLIYVQNEFGTDDEELINIIKEFSL
jgi:hypothetical protein